MIIDGQPNWSAYRAKGRRLELEIAVQNILGPIVNISDIPVDRLEALAVQNNLRVTQSEPASTPQPNVDEGERK